MDYYSVLNITNKATAKEIKNAYRKLAKKYHPDTYEGKKEFAESKMKEINEAYDILSDEAKRKEYDLKNNVFREEEKETSYDYNYTGEIRRPDFYNTNYYHYAPAKDEKYNINSIRYDELFKNKIFGIVIAVIIAVLLIIFIIINMISSVMKILTPPAYDTLPPEQNVTQKNSLKSFDAWYETEGKAYEEQLKKDFDEWYAKEGKVYEQELNKFLEDIEKEINRINNNN